jgi:hypothetical protein
MKIVELYYRGIAAETLGHDWMFIDIEKYLKDNYHLIHNFKKCEDFYKGKNGVFQTVTFFNVMDESKFALFMLKYSQHISKIIYE